MNTIRSIVMLAILGAVGFGVYATLNKRPIPDPPEGLPDGWDSNPAVQLGDSSGPPSVEGLGGAFPSASVELPGTSLSTPAPTASAPAFVPPPSPMAQAASDAPAYTPPPAAASPPTEAAPFTPPLTPPATGAVDAPPAADPTSVAVAPPADPSAMPATPPGAVAPPGFSEPPPFGDAPAYSGAPDPNIAPVAPPADAQPFPSAQSPVPGAPDVASGAAAAPLAPPAADLAGTAAQAMPGAPNGTPPAELAAQAASPNELPPGTLPPPAGADLAAAAPPAAASAPVTPGDFNSTWTSVQQALAQDRLVDALRELSRWYGSDQLGPAEQQAVQALLDQLAGTVIYSRESLLETAYEVQPGDTLERVATYYNLPWQLLAKINGVSDPQVLNAGEQLKVVRGPFSADVNLHKFRLTLWLGDLYAGSFPIGVGADYSTTPEGDFTVQQKLENPTYYGPDQVVDANDPANPLGEHWISLGNHLGIHGTIDEQSIGKAESRGCIRMTQRDISDVYDMLTPGSKVTIKR